MQEGNEIQYT